MLKVGVKSATIIGVPIYAVWLLFTYLLGIPNDILRFFALWAFILILNILAGPTDEIRKHRGF